MFSPARHRCPYTRRPPFARYPSLYRNFSRFNSLARTFHGLTIAFARARSGYLHGPLLDHIFPNTPASPHFYEVGSASRLTATMLAWFAYFHLLASDSFRVGSASVGLSSLLTSLQLSVIALRFSRYLPLCDDLCLCWQLAFGCWPLGDILSLVTHILSLALDASSCPL